MCYRYRRWQFSFRPVFCIHLSGPTLRGADAHPCAFNYLVRFAVVSVIQAGLASGGGRAQLTLIVGRRWV